jgi:3-isopropylmalate/(R)-2-methylmalate dehydratase small subunit
MQPFTVVTAVAAPLEIAKIDTGMILPGRYMRRHRRPGHDYGEAFLYDLRFDDTGQMSRARGANATAIAPIDVSRGAEVAAAKPQPASRARRMLGLIPQ